MRSIQSILFVSNQYSPNIVGGAEVTVQTLAEELHHRGFRVAVVSLAPDNRCNQDLVNGIRVHRIPIANAYVPFQGPRHSLLKAAWHARDVYNPTMAAAVGKVIEAENPDWVSTHNLSGFSVSVWREVKRRGIGLSHMAHDLHLLCPRSTMFKAGESCARQCLSCTLLSSPKKLASPQVDVALGISHHILQKHLKHGYFRGAKHAVVHNSRPWSGGQPRVRRASGAAFRIGYIGRLEESKGVHVLLAAAAKLKTESWEVILAGRAPDREYLQRLKDMASDDPRISFKGFVAPHTFYEGIDALAVPSVSEEGLGMVACEALGYGLPVVVSRIGGLVEVVDDSRAGALFEPGDSRELASRLDAFAEDGELFEDASRAAIERRRYFTPTRQANDFLSAVGAV